MSDNIKKKNGSFRKLFPLFFSHKSKEKTNKDTQSTFKGVDDVSINNQYQNPRAIRSDKYGQGDSERIYENLATSNVHTDNDTLNINIPSNHSSSSTLVSESVKMRNTIANTFEAQNIEKDYINYAARPQVPPKPHNEMVHPSINHIYNSSKYPDVYYHSLEKLTDKISPQDEIEIYRASQAQGNPASVGAEIKRVSTKFLISPKKEADVRTIQPTRARSLSLDNNKDQVKPGGKNTINQVNVAKPYNYSAPTSPMPVNHKIPNMPKTVSPYEHVRKNMIEAEEKRNSLNRTTNRIKSTPSPRPIHSYRSTPISTLPKETQKYEEMDKEKTRQKVEAFYWQKLKEMKQKEDEYFLRQSSLRNPIKQKVCYTISNCSTPNSVVIEPRSCSLPRGKDLRSYMNQPVYSPVPFARGVPERRTDTFIKNRPPVDSEIVYRQLDKLNIRTTSPILLQERKMYNRDTFPLDRNDKRVSFEEHRTSNACGSVVNEANRSRKLVNTNEYPQYVKVSETRGPPRPPVRTTSVGAKQTLRVANNGTIVHLPTGQSVYSESESGSEAGEIQRILHGNTHKGKYNNEFI
ncbi:hypothetical protein O3G_MSEX009510 [Manduca sexta]|uniref:Uncharacterized protein n=1 Tax=Manduca sexta TaxID=7130 RepID=A0A922CRQ7_MANSE|nr:hypothetical protein O3G_MSEX009510 [Manduca sexta]